jgi:RNA polymerase primary sigma factor
MSDIIKQYFKEIKDNRGLDKETTREIALKAQQGDPAALELLVKNHLLLVAKIARQYVGKGVEFADLIAEGNSGLLNAVEKWNSEKGASFTTCATWWIKQAIIRNCMHSNRIVRLPEHVSELMRTGRLPDFNYGEVNIDRPNEEGHTLAEALPDKEVDIFASEEQALMRKLLNRVMKFLKPKEKKVIEMHYGLNGTQEMDVQQIAEHLQLTTTRINQIIRSSIKKMQEHKEEIA